MPIKITKKNIVGQELPRPAAPANNPALRPVYVPPAPVAKLTYDQVTDRFRRMAIGDLMLTYPEMGTEEAASRIAGDTVCNQLHAIVLDRAKAPAIVAT